MKNKELTTRQKNRLLKLKQQKKKLETKLEQIEKEYIKPLEEKIEALRVTIDDIELE